MLYTRRIVAAASIAAFLSLAACKPTDVVSGPDDAQKDELAKAKPVALPPAIIASKTYRCKDNSLVYIDFYNDQKSATFRSKKDGDPVALAAAEPGKPYEAAGYSVKGSGTGSEVTVSSPGKGSQSCKA